MRIGVALAPARWYQRMASPSPAGTPRPRSCSKPSVDGAPAWPWAAARPYALAAAAAAAAAAWSCASRCRPLATRRTTGCSMYTRRTFTQWINHSGMQDAGATNWNNNVRASLTLCCFDPSTREMSAGRVRCDFVGVSPGTS